MKALGRPIKDPLWANTADVSHLELEPLVLPQAQEPGLPKLGRDLKDLDDDTRRLARPLLFAELANLDSWDRFPWIPTSFFGQAMEAADLISAWGPNEKDNARGGALHRWQNGTV